MSLEPCPLQNNMATRAQFRKMVVANDYVPVKIPGSLKYRLVRPALYALLGVSLGAITGTAIAIAGSPDGESLFSIASLKSGPAAEPVPVVASSPQQQTHPDAVKQVPSISTSATDADHLTASAAAKGTLKPNLPVKAERSTNSHSTPSQVPEAGKKPHFRTASGARRFARRVARPPVEPALTEMSGASNDGPPLMAAADEEFNDPKPVNFYVEGNLTVADYDANAGTIETSDGRTFIVGTTVLASNAISWNEYRSNVHYRCSQAGDCTLSRAVVVAPNARLI